MLVFLKARSIRSLTFSPFSKTSILTKPKSSVVEVKSRSVTNGTDERRERRNQVSVSVEGCFRLHRAKKVPSELSGIILTLVLQVARMHARLPQSSLASLAHLLRSLSTTTSVPAVPVGATRREQLSARADVCTTYIRERTEGGRASRTESGV